MTMWLSVQTWWHPSADSRSPSASFCQCALLEKTEMQQKRMVWIYIEEYVQESSSNSSEINMSQYSAKSLVLLSFMIFFFCHEQKIQQQNPARLQGGSNTSSSKLFCCFAETLTHRVTAVSSVAPIPKARYCIRLSGTPDSWKMSKT